jgi:hypothetical protein
VDVDLSVDERNLILVALWKVRQTLAGRAKEASGLDAGAGIDQVAEKLGGKPGLLVYGLGEPPGKSPAET